MERLRMVIVWCAIAAAALLGATMLLPPLAGYERYVITGDSMSPSIDRGSIAYAQRVPVEDLRVGDVITYEPPGRAGHKVTHRIVWAGRGASGRRAFRTKGDANRAADPWRFELDGPAQARVDAHLPWIGYAVAALGVRWLRVIVIGVPALIVAASSLAGVSRVEGAAA